MQPRTALAFLAAAAHCQLIQGALCPNDWLGGCGWVRVAGLVAMLSDFLNGSPSEALSYWGLPKPRRVLARGSSKPLQAPSSQPLARKEVNGEGGRQGRKEGNREEGKEMEKEARKVGKKEEGREGEGRKERKKEMEGRKEEGREGRKE
ncbi:Cyclic nucleotide-gated cation channel beta-1, partial [Ophiophagus hannah]